MRKRLQKMKPEAAAAEEATLSRRPSAGGTDGAEKNRRTRYPQTAFTPRRFEPSGRITGQTT
ncbi:MAG: hypothetical protein U5N86_01460 [Planctomycetota bacterium]|nr:hypothetical protein [Planctomycetota bacterium]